MKKVIISLSIIGVVAAVIIGGTIAFFSDTETSTGNILRAGAIDLKIDNESYVTDANGVLVHSSNTSWGLEGPMGLFFNFTDLKPGDLGEDTISLHVYNNDAWACMSIALTGTPDNDITEPEGKDDLTPNPDSQDGELQDELYFAFWADDGDNVYEVGEVIFEQGLAGDIFDGTSIALADSSKNIWGQSPFPLTGEITYHVGKVWCFGELEKTPYPQDALNTSGPLDRGTGFVCDGSQVGNASQTDGIVADVTFYAEQSRNNSNFVCQAPRPIVGANLTGYTAPSCSVTVSGSNSIQTELDNTNNTTICVASDYSGSGDTYPLTIDRNGITLAGLGNATLPGGTFIDADNVTFTGLTVSNYSYIQSSENAAVYIHSGISGIEVSYNKLIAPTDAKTAQAKGIVTEIGGSTNPGASALAIHNNLVEDWRQGMFFNTANYEVSFNDIYDNDVGVANDGPQSSSIHNNDFEDNALEAVGINSSANNGTGNDGSLTVNTNNLSPAGAGNDVNWYGSSVFGGADVDAENNWWNGEAEVSRTNSTSEVDTVPAEGSAYPEY